jgi:hypothetical protein
MTVTSLPASASARATGYADYCNAALTLRVSRHAERPDHVGERVTDFEVREFVRGLADAHEDEADPAVLGGPIAEGERDAFATLACAHHEELAGARLGGDSRGLDAHLEDGL